MPKRKLKGFQKYQPPVGKKSREYRQVWRLVDGCVVFTFLKRREQGAPGTKVGAPDY